MPEKGFICNVCNDTGIMEDNGSLITCVYCVTRQQFMKALETAILNAKRQRKRKLHENLIQIQSLLPKYPVMAALEAEARGMRSEFISFLRDAFDVKELWTC